MRYQTLVFAAFLVVLAAYSAQAQELTFQLGEEGFEAQRDLRGGRKADPAPPQVMGRITDFAGRSIKAAEVTFFCVDCDEVVKVRSNAFGYYTVSDLTDGHTYLIAVQHRKYLFLIGSDQVTAGPETFEFNFLGEPVR